LPESPDLHKDIKEMKWRLESLDSTQNLMIRADRKKYLEVAKAIFGDSKQRALIYRNVDGKRGQAKLAKDLGIDKGNLSRHLQKLREGSLIEVVTIERDGSVVYKKSKWYKLLRIDKWLDEEFPIG